jgi:hypothetical protein
LLQWTGERPWMDLIQRALIWEAREPDAYVNVFFGFPWSDVPDAGAIMPPKSTWFEPKLADGMVSHVLD